MRLGTIPGSTPGDADVLPRPGSTRNRIRRFGLARWSVTGVELPAASDLKWEGKERVERGVLQSRPAPPPHQHASVVVRQVGVHHPHSAHVSRVRLTLGGMG